MTRRILSLVALLACFTIAWSNVPAHAVAPAKADDDTQKIVYFSKKGPVLIELHLRIDGRSFRYVWGKLMASLFDYLDRNHDGVLSEEEASQAPPASVLASSFGFFGGNGNSSARSSKRGKMTREMFAEHYRKAGLPPFQISFSKPNNGVLELDAATGGIKGSTSSAGSLNTRLFKLLDTDGDGKLSRAELAAAPTVLGKLDADEDEMISTAELLGRGGESSDGNRDAVFAFNSDNGAPIKSTNRSFHVVSDAAADRELGKRLLAHYGKKGAKTLDPKTLNLDRQELARLDRNGDGVLDAEELSALGQLSSDLSFTVRLGKRADKEKAVEQRSTQKPATPRSKEVTVKPSGDGVVLEMGNVRLDLHGPQTQGARFAFDIRQQYLSQFKAADLDNNGYLDKEEAKKSPLFRDLFAAMDRDGDGMLFEKEVIAYLDQMDQLRKQAGKSCLSLIVTDSGKGLFELADRDSDGRLSVRELRQMAQLLDRLGADREGKLTLDAIPRHYKGGFELGAAGAGGGGNGVFVVSAFMGGGMPTLPEKTRGPLWFRKMDRNRDGDVSRKEWLGTEEEFRAIDTDGDGLISVEEAEAFDKRVRGKK